METARPVLAEIIGEVVKNAEKECIGFVLARHALGMSPGMGIFKKKNRSD